MNHVKESNIHPMRRDNRHDESGDSRPSYQKYTCSTCKNQFSACGIGFIGCPHCTNRVSSSHISLPNPLTQNSARSQQSVARNNATSRQQSAFSDAPIHVNRCLVDQIERQLPSIRDVPALRRALDIGVPPGRDSGQQSHTQQYPTLRGSQDNQHDLPSLRSRQVALHNGVSEHQERPMLPDPRCPYSQSRTDQYSHLSGDRYQDYHHYYDGE
ncbi:hypothetical protein EV127DRAFT_413700 [Xylaria flabelliformis]|nr:hypothetical protein EV127DRAFT_413700 [Xylaria flabelliformis]